MSAPSEETTSPSRIPRAQPIALSPVSLMDVRTDPDLLRAEVAIAILTALPITDYLEACGLGFRNERIPDLLRRVAIQ